MYFETLTDLSNIIAGGDSPLCSHILASNFYSKIFLLFCSCLPSFHLSVRCVEEESSQCILMF